MIQDPKHVWYTTAEVIARYGFDPIDHLESTTARDGCYIRSKLMVVSHASGCSLVRYWLEDDLAEPSKKAAARRVFEQEDLIRRRITAGYTKGLRKS